MIERARRSMLSAIAPLTLLAIASPSPACPVISAGHESTIPIELTPTHKTTIQVWSWEANDEIGTQPSCSAEILVPLSAFPSARLVARPADFASDIREILAEWDVSKCRIVVWVENDTGDDLTEAESCMIEDFRYDGDSVWSAGSEHSCMSDRGI